MLIFVSSSDVDKGKDPNIKVLNEVWILLDLSSECHKHGTLMKTTLEETPWQTLRS